MVSYIYGIHGPDGKIRYVGSTINPAQRMRQHRHVAFVDSNHEYRLDRSAWIREVGRNNISMRILDVVPDEIRAPMERIWISDLLEMGMHLFNLGNTPRGSSNWNSMSAKISAYRSTPEARSAQAEVARRVLRKPEYVEKIRQLVRSPERRAAASLRSRGERSGNAKLTESNVREIIARGKYAPYSEIAEQYCVKACTIGDILRGKTWKHIDRGGGV